MVFFNEREIMSKNLTLEIMSDLQYVEVAWELEW